MKARISLLCAGMLLACVASLAQEPHPQRDPIGEILFPPELIMQNQKAIGLEEAQRNSIRAEILKAQGRFTELQWQLQDAMEALTSILKQNSVEEQQALAQLDKVLNSEREIKRTQIGLLVRIKNKLTPEQQSRLRELRGESGGESCIYRKLLDK